MGVDGMGGARNGMAGNGMGHLMTSQIGVVTTVAARFRDWTEMYWQELDGTGMEGNGPESKAMERCI